MRFFFAGVALLTVGISARALEPSPAATRATAAYVPDSLSAYVRPESSPLRELVDRFREDRDDLVRFYSVSGSALQTAGSASSMPRGRRGSARWISRPSMSRDASITRS